MHTDKLFTIQLKLCVIVDIKFRKVSLCCLLLLSLSESPSKSLNDVVTSKSFRNNFFARAQSLNAKSPNLLYKKLSQDLSSMAWGYLKIEPDRTLNRAQSDF